MRFGGSPFSVVLSVGARAWRAEIATNRQRSATNGALPWPARRITGGENPDVQRLLPMELGGFAPPTSWVRSKAGRRH